MKRFFWVTLGVVGAAILGGCPIYADNANQRVCTVDGCFDCTNDYYSGSCTPWQCNSSTDCPSGYYCSGSNTCVGGANPSYDGGTPPGSCSSPTDCSVGSNCGTDGQCHPGDCSNSGCPSGFQCKLSNGSLQCVGTGTRDGGSTGDGGKTDGGVTGCQTDAQCASLGAGAKCLDGTCVKAADQCSDATQCPNNEQCVQGVCTPSCGAQANCPAGYSCDPTKGVCTGNPTSCGNGQSCTSNTVCVEDHCVPPCGAGNTCPSSLVCVNGGCIPDQKPQFVCGTEGTPGNGAPGNCAVGSLCLHHNCYIACGSDAGVDGGGCRAADKFNVCKQVTTSSGTYSVCGSSSNLGSECDPTAGRNCAGALICIDGFCR